MKPVRRALPVALALALAVAAAGAQAQPPRRDPPAAPVPSGAPSPAAAPAPADPAPAPGPSPVFAPPVVTAIPDTASAGPARAGPEPVTTKWWFWAAVGGVLLVTVGVLAFASGSPDPPVSRLGDMEAFRRR
jgi:hypothetical protein